MGLFKRSAQPLGRVINEKRADQLTLADSIIMPSGTAYSVTMLEQLNTSIAIEVAAPNTGGAWIERLYVGRDHKFEVKHV